MGNANNFFAANFFAALTRTFVLFAGLCLFAISSTAHSANRQALVIGNSSYGSGHSLVTPLNDSTAIADKLASIGYQVHGGGAQLDLTLDQFNNEIDAFLASVDNGSSTLIYYAGHGAASAGSNYLIPILPEGVRLQSDSDIRDRSVSLQGIMERVEQRNPSGVNVFFFDACRDAPVDNFTRSINLTGLANLDTGRQPRGSFVGFSTEYGKLALDGDPAGNSPFAAAILNSLDTSATAPIELFYKEVTEQVYDETSGQQFPIQEAKIRGDHCIIECKIRASADRAQDFGYLTVNTKPLDAEVCYQIDGWKTWNCGEQVVLPLYKQVMVKVTAKGHKTYTTSTQLSNNRQQLVANLEPKSNRTMLIVGGVAAAVVVGGLLLSGGSSGSGGGGDGGDDAFNITLVRP